MHSAEPRLVYASMVAAHSRIRRNAVIIAADANVTRPPACPPKQASVKPASSTASIGDFEQQSLLGIRRRSLARADPEELRIESVDLIEKAAPAACSFARLGRIRVIHRRQMPAVVGDLADGVGAADQQIHRSSGFLTPPGNRQPIPTIATGSTGVMRGPTLSQLKCKLGMASSTASSGAASRNFLEQQWASSE